MESLETRQLLSVSLPTIPDTTVLAGAPLHLVLDGVSSSGNPVQYSVSVTNPLLTATVPQVNPSLKMTVSSTANNIHGDMVFELFEDLAPDTVAKISALVDGDFYDGLVFHRVIEHFMIQGGDPEGTGSGGPGFQFDDEFNVALQFTTPGLLAMANSGPDTNGSQFFITAIPTRWLDFDHPIFGLLTSGDSIRQQIAAVPVGTWDRPVDSVVMTDVSLVEDNQHGVLRLAAPHGTTGIANVTVTATDAVTGETATRSFRVTVAPDSDPIANAHNSEPFLNKIAPLEATAGTPVTFQIPATDIEGDSIYYDVRVASGGANLAVTVNHATGRATVTPAVGASGVYGLTVTVSRSGNTPDDTQYVPVTVRAPVTGSIAGFVYEDSDNDGQRITPTGKTSQALAGVTLRLYRKNVSGIWIEVAGKSPIQTAADGSYRFANLAPGTYRITVVFPTEYLAGKATAGKIGGRARGSVGQGFIQVQIAGGDNGTEYNFGVRGLRPGLISKRLFLSSRNH